MQSERPKFPIRGAEPHQWGRHKLGRQREREYKRLVRESYNAAMAALELKPGEHARGRWKLGVASKVQLVALKRVARLLFNEAHDADGVLNKIRQHTDEQVARSNAG